MYPAQFMIAIKRMDQWYNDTITRCGRLFGLNRVEVSILLFLANNPGFDTARDVAETRRISKSNVSKAVDSLMARGFLTVQADSKDRRLLRLSLTPAAQAPVQAAQAAQARFFETLHQGIAPEDLGALERTVAQIVQNLQKEDFSC